MFSILGFLNFGDKFPTLYIFVNILWGDGVRFAGKFHMSFRT